MAQQRAPITTHALDDARVPLTPRPDGRELVEAPRRTEDAPSETFLQGFASLRPTEKRDRLVPYPIRLPASQIAELEELKAERGIVPAEFIRDAVASCLKLLRKA